MHGDKSQSQRQRALARFEAGDADSYVHRVGRTGRAGRRGTGISFVLADQADDVLRMARDLGLSREFQAARS